MRKGNRAAGQGEQAEYQAAREWGDFANPRGVKGGLAIMTVFGLS